MADLLWYQYVLIGLIFAWSGFVRTSLGFGGAVLALPFLPLVVNEPLVFLPIIAIHLLIFPVGLPGMGIVSCSRRAAALRFRATSTGAI
ncbi:hypothetical protein HAALTHF_05370n [Vreelandella aquamarina]|nr:hypothetical protein HAALTHF_05370n [Halomonas axialensis]